MPQVRTSVCSDWFFSVSNTSDLEPDPDWSGFVGSLSLRLCLPPPMECLLDRLDVGADGLPKVRANQLRLSPDWLSFTEPSSSSPAWDSGRRPRCRNVSGSSRQSQYNNTKSTRPTFSARRLYSWRSRFCRGSVEELPPLLSVKGSSASLPLDVHDVELP